MSFYRWVVFISPGKLVFKPFLRFGGAALVVSQFTLYADCRKGRRPGFVDAARPEQAIPLYEAFCQRLRIEGITVATGVFGAKMAVSLVNDGPVTVIIDSAHGVS